MDKRTILFIVLVTLSFFGINYLFPPKEISVQTTTQKSKEEILTPVNLSQKTTPASFSHEMETFYVLENSTLQLVFSNLGGALSEINLPFVSKENHQSVVKPIEIDKEILSDSPENAAYPLFPYHINGSKQETKQKNLGGYYPLLRRSIKQQNNLIQIPPQFYALNVIDPSSTREPTIYTVSRFEKNLIEFQASLPSGRITKIFSLPSESDLPYVFDLEVRIEGNPKNLWISSGIPEAELISGRAISSLGYHFTNDQKKSLVEKISLPKTSSLVSSVHPDWISNSNRFFGTILDPITQTPDGYLAEMVPGNLVPTRLTLIDAEHNRYAAEKFPGYQLFLPLGNESITHYRIFSGPYQTNILKQVDDALSDKATGYNPEYKNAQTYKGWFSFISVPFAKFLFFLMDLFHTFTHSWGIAIILLTIVLRIMLYPLNTWSIRSTLKMQEISPKVKSLQERYKKDPQKAQMEVMKLYKESGANPFTGCLPMLIQMPFLFGMFDLLQTSFQLRGAGFIPGWIDNLTAPDVLFSWSYPIPLIGTQFHFLPILLGVGMYLQQKLSTTLPKDKSEWTDQHKQQHMMTTIMPIVFTFIFYKFPSGLTLYWLSSTLLGIGQQWLMTKKGKNKQLKKSY